MKTIIAATDFSDAAVNAADFAADMALSVNAELVLLYTIQPPVTYSEVAIPLDIEGMQKTAEAEMMKFKAKLTERTRSKLSISTEVRMGSFFSELKAVCERIKPYAVVMGSQGTSATERFLFGGHAVHAMKHLPWPLITVPAGNSFSNINHIALACDFENITGTVPVAELKQLTADFNATLHIINTSKEDKYNPDTVFGSTMLNTMLAPIKPAYHLLTDNNTDESIMRFAETNNINLLIVLPKQHGFFEALTHKSHTKQMVLHSQIPVMAIHMPDNK